MRPDPTQLRLASAREEAYQELHDSQPLAWTAQGELQKLQKGHFLDISTDIPEDDEIPWKNTPWDVQTDSVDIQAQEQQHSRKLLKKQVLTTIKAVTPCSQALTRRFSRQRNRLEFR